MPAAAILDVREAERAGDEALDQTAAQLAETSRRPRCREYNRSSSPSPRSSRTSRRCRATRLAVDDAAHAARPKFARAPVVATTTADDDAGGTVQDGAA